MKLMRLAFMPVCMQQSAWGAAAIGENAALLYQEQQIPNERLFR
jgi:hypothetical protein